MQCLPERKNKPHIWIDIKSRKQQYFDSRIQKNKIQEKTVSGCLIKSKIPTGAIQAENTGAFRKVAFTDPSKGTGEQGHWPCWTDSPDLLDWESRPSMSTLKVILMLDGHRLA